IPEGIQEGITERVPAIPGSSPEEKEGGVKPDGRRGSSVDVSFQTSPSVDVSLRDSPSATVSSVSPSEEPGALRDLFELQVDWNPDRIAELTRPCTGCGDCRDRSVRPRGCPVFRMDPSELSTPRAMVNLVRGILTGRLPREIVAQRAFRMITDRCIQCRLCSVNCPSRVDVSTLVSELKGAYVAANGLSLREWFVCRPDLMCAIASGLSPVMRGALQNRGFRWLLDRVFGVARQRQLPEITSWPFLRRAAKRGYSRLPRYIRTSTSSVPSIPSVPPGSSESGTPKVAYFVDSSANWNDPLVGESLVAILEAHDIPVYVPADQVPSGSMAIRCGAFDIAEMYANRNLNALTEAVRQGYTILTTEPSAALSLQKEYPSLLGSTESTGTSEGSMVAGEEDVRLVAGATQDACLFLWKLHLAGKLRTDFQEIPERMGYYAPCQLIAMDIGLPGLDLLRLIPGLQIRLIEAGCCGMAGLRGIRSEYFRESLRIGRNLASRIRDMDCTTVVTECGSCRIQIEQMSGRMTCHPIRILAAAWGLTSFPGAPLLPGRSRRRGV
ncbi:MAG: heterodisulfide reductase-related iron-sulfur binding cluster, partial [Planctomycetia bacterium]|nr:heterodisulfide reductase-related iron-sulfur binding cluster [Planctomycetia bacterium]